MSTLRDSLRHLLRLTVLALAFGACAPGGQPEPLSDDDDEVAGGMRFTLDGAGSETVGGNDETLELEAEQ